MSDWLALIDSLDTRLTDDKQQSTNCLDPASLDDILRKACAVVRDASAENASHLEDIVAKTQELISRGVAMAYESSQKPMFDYIPSLAHSDETPLVRDKLNTALGQGQVDVLLPFIEEILADRPGRSGYGYPVSLKVPTRWDPELQPHLRSTRLSRFGPGVTVSATRATPLAQAIYQARCEITDDTTMVPAAAFVSPGQSCLAVASAGGWKNRDPLLCYYFLDNDSPLSQSKCFCPGLSEVAYAMAMDEDRKLIFVSDSYRAKSYSWDASHRSQDDELPPVHTLNSGGCEGGIAILPDGHIARAGRGQALLWNIDELEQHGPKRRRIGAGRFEYKDHTMREIDSGEEIEDSTGSVPHTSVAFADGTFYPGAWHLHAPSGRMICGSSGQRDQVYACVAIDLEHGGKTAARYLGHGGEVVGISTSGGDSNVFMTAGNDGYARMFDVRQPLPVMTFDHGNTSEYCSSVVLVHPDGIPTLFTGGRKSEQIKLWDIRARETVCELATGNNGVAAMAWDAGHAALYAATECDWVDRLGFHHFYRPAHIPKWADGERPDGEGDEVEDFSSEEEIIDGDDEDYSDEDEYDRCWPERAYHGEDYFGYAFDAGDHRIYRYVFKENPDPAQLPVYGDASMNESYW